MLTELFRGQHVRLAALNPEKDAEAIARWSLDSEYLRLLDSDPARPETAQTAKDDMTRRAAREREFGFGIRTLADDRLIGFVDLWVGNWASAEGRVGIGIGERAEQGQGYGTEAMELLLQYAFAELNLARVGLEVFAANARAIRSYQKAGFRLEGTQREWLRRDGDRGDLAFMGILQADYQRAHGFGQPEIREAT